jgi:hypothetical protein
MHDAIPITPLMDRYCDAASELWNGWFAPLLGRDFDRPSMETENGWDLRDRYEDVCVDLFASLVLWPLGCHDLQRLPAYRSVDQQPVPSIRVESTHPAEIRVAAKDVHPFQGYDVSITQTDQADLDIRFREFFDFDVMNSRAFEWVHGVVFSSADRPDLLGRSILLRRSDVEFSWGAP